MPLSRQDQLTIHKFFIRPHLGYGIVTSDQPINESLSKRTESIRYKAALVLTGAIKGSSREKLDKEIGLQHLLNRRWMR